MNEFRTKIKNAYMLKEIDKTVYDYSMETLKNLKRFIKYKEGMFKKQNL